MFPLITRNAVLPLAMTGLLAMAGCSDQASSATGDAAERAELKQAATSRPKVETAVGESEERVQSGPAESDPAESNATSVAAPRDSVREKLVDKSFDDIKFEMDKEEPFDRSMLTPEIEALSGNRIRIRGYILPTAQRRGIRQFVLVRDNRECCFGPGAALFDCIVVRMLPGKTAEFTIRPVTVEGRFVIEEFAPLGTHLAIYRIDGESVK